MGDLPQIKVTYSNHHLNYEKRSATELILVASNKKGLVIKAVKYITNNLLKLAKLFSK